MIYFKLNTRLVPIIDWLNLQDKLLSFYSAELIYTAVFIVCIFRWLILINSFKISVNLDASFGFVAMNWPKQLSIEWVWSKKQFTFLVRIGECRKKLEWLPFWADINLFLTQNIVISSATAFQTTKIATYLVSQSHQFRVQIDW